MDNRYSNKEKSWWQHLSVSSKVYSIMALVCLAIVGSVGYFVNASNPAKAGYFMMAVCFFVIVVMWFGAIILRTIDTKNNEKLTEQADQTLKQAQEVYKQTAQLNKHTQKMVDREDARRQAEEDFLDTPDRDDDWEERAEELDQQKQAMTGEQPEEEIFREPTPEELEQIKAELHGFDYDLDTEQVLAAHYYRQMRKAGKIKGDNTSVGKVIAEIERIHTGKINVKLINAILSGEVVEEAISPEENTGDQTKQPIAISAAPQPLLIEKKPDPPEQLEQPSNREGEYPSIEKQAAELGVKVAELKFYLRGKPYYGLMPAADLAKVRRLAKMRA